MNVTKVSQLQENIILKFIVFSHKLKQITEYNKGYSYVKQIKIRKRTDETEQLNEKTTNLGDVSAITFWNDV